MERASLRFPEGVDDYRIYKYGGSSQTVCRLSIRYNDDDNLYNNIEKNLVRPIQRIDGVADVSFRIRRKGIQIEVDKDRAEAYRLSISRLSRRLRGDNFTLSRTSVKAVFVVAVSATPCCCCGCATGRGCCDSCGCTGEWVAAWMPATLWCGW